MCAASLAGPLAGTIGLALPAPAAAATTPIPKDYALIARDVIPSGESGAVPIPAGATTQAQMYDALTPLFNHVSDAQLPQFFKPETLGIATPGPVTTETVPHAGVTITRDGYDVPHVNGVTRDDVTWGAGWVIAEDRGLLLQEARYDSLVAAIDAPGVSALGLVSGLQSFKPTVQTENEVAKQTNVLLAHGAKGRAVLHDIDVYLQGINAYFSSHGSTAPPFTRIDIYAFNALKDQFVGEGGGDEAERAEFLSGLQRKLGPKRGREVWNDLREAYDPEAPASVPGHVQLQPKPKSDSGNVILDNNSLTSAAAQDLATQRQWRGHASNALLVSGKRSATHHPIMVAGPQIGYFYPGLTTEIDLDRPRDQPARGHLSAVPRLRLHRPQSGRRLVADLRGPGSDRHLRRDPVWPQQAQVPVRRQVPLDDVLRRRHPQPGKQYGEGDHLLPDRPRAGDRLRPRSRSPRGADDEASQLRQGHP